MSSVAEIEATIERLSPEELRRVAQRVDELFRRAKGTAIYEDSYGLLSDADLMSRPTRRFRNTTAKKPKTTAAQRGEVWLVDLGLAAKVRPALVISVPYRDDERALFSIVPHTTSTSDSL